MMEWWKSQKSEIRASDAGYWILEPGYWPNPERRKPQDGRQLPITPFWGHLDFVKFSMPPALILDAGRSA
jgi:hypothetical protein